ncbi:regulatory protein GemA [Candidatus Sororendozoicomonas aggregata]|uniref:gp16 family protein n=1 Tax=Candidatus Sororendozoicomonas aggregata TaxID=3073239 RepID=UPI002ED66B92
MREERNARQGNSNNRARALARIHIARKQLGMDEAQYRTMLEGQTGKNSCKTMSIGELFQVEAYLKKLGFKPAKSRKARAKRYSPASRRKPVDKLRAIWIEMASDGLIRDGSENALEVWVQRMSAKYNQGRGIEKVDWLMREPYVCARVLESLKRWDARARASLRMPPTEEPTEGDSHE